MLARIAKVMPGPGIFWQVGSVAATGLSDVNYISKKARKEAEELKRLEREARTPLRTILKRFIGTKCDASIVAKMLWRGFDIDTYKIKGINYEDFDYIPKLKTEKILKELVEKDHRIGYVDGPECGKSITLAHLVEGRKNVMFMDLDPSLSLRNTFPYLFRKEGSWIDAVLAAVFGDDLFGDLQNADEDDVLYSLQRSEKVLQKNEKLRKLRYKSFVPSFICPDDSSLVIIENNRNEELKELSRTGHRTIVMGKSKYYTSHFVCSEPFKSLIDAKSFCEHLLIDCNDEVKCRLGEFAFEFGDSDGFILREAAEILEENPQLELEEVNKIIVGRIKEDLQTWLNASSAEQFSRKRLLYATINSEIIERPFDPVDRFFAEFRRPIIHRNNRHLFASRVNVVAIKEMLD
eukprot:TRINITY_DN687784_c0_g2_i2.p1 TRINITY_DN687784_c0_g2~~TRINITY_DN687784_c0_g2_i2.p1  ORF type:complete len:406 (+),score=102.38 TRINITY_DN687784_c0_g2_i2:80-1297(+)